MDAAAAPTLTEVERAREVMAGLRADLEAQERRTQQLQEVIARGAARAQLPARQAASAAAAEEKTEHSGATAVPSSFSTQKAAPIGNPAMEFLGAALVAMGRAISLALSGGTKPSGR